MTSLCVWRSDRASSTAWAARGASALAQRDGQLRVKVPAFFETSCRSYGNPRIWKDLVEDSEAVSRKRVVRLMQEDGLQARLKGLTHPAPAAGGHDELRLVPSPICQIFNRRNCQILDRR